MLSFSANMKVLRDCEEIRNINGFEYRVYYVQAAKLTMPALFSIREQVHIGDCIMSDEVFLTNYSEEHTPSELALRVGNFVVADESVFELGEFLEVKVHAKVYKSKGKPLREVGVLRKPFLSCYVGIKNEMGKPFNVLLVSFYKLAERLEKVEGFSYINLYARLNRKLNQDGYELNLSNFELVTKKQ